MLNTVASEKEGPDYAAQSQLINATMSRRFLTAVLLGPGTSLGEASTMQFVTKNTSVPVPRVYCALVH